MLQEKAMIICSLRYPAYNEHAPYCHLWSAPLYIIHLTLSHKRHDFRKKKKNTEHKTCVLIFSTTFVRNIFHSEKKRARYEKIYVGLHVTCPLFLSDINKTRLFSTDFRKKTQIPNFIKIRLVIPELFHADRRTDMMKLIDAIRNFANAPNKGPMTDHRVARENCDGPSIDWL